MPISFRFQAQAGLLRVKASGRDDGLKDVQGYGLAILQEAIRLGTPRILCDERELEYDLDIVESFESARSLMAAIAEQAPRCARVAIVSSPKFLSEARFWTHVAGRRVLSMRAFSDLEEAEAWVAEEE